MRGGGRNHGLHLTEEGTEAQRSLRPAAGHVPPAPLGRHVTCFESLLLSLSLAFSFSFLGSNKFELAVVGTLLSETDFPTVNKETWENTIRICNIKNRRESPRSSQTLRSKGRVSGPEAQSGGLPSICQLRPGR